METVIEFGEKEVTPGIRMLFDMKDVIYDRKWFSRSYNLELYYMYRDLSLSKKDALTIKEQGLRYDITVIPPLMLGCEFVKTAGHYHPLVDGTEFTYPEIYEVLKGEAHYLMQRSENDTIEDVILIKAGEGNKVIIPPGYGHITINASNKVLKMANWVARDFESIYRPIKEKGGGAYFFLDNGLFRNPNYHEVPDIRKLKTSPFREIGLEKGKEMYGLVENMENLEFLTNPREYEWIFEKFLEN